MRVPASVALSLALCGAGCSLLVDNDPDDLGASARDATRADGGADASSADGGRRIDGRDAGPPVEGRDAGPPVERRDAGPPVEGRDGGHPDAGRPDAGRPDAGPPAEIPGRVECGDAACDAREGELCCHAEGRDPYCARRSGRPRCECSGLFCDTFEVDCDGPEDCAAGQTCCAERGITDDEFRLVTCRERCDSGAITVRRVVCRDRAACADGAACESVDGPDGLRVCGGD